MSEKKTKEMKKLLDEYYESIDDPFASTEISMSIVDKVGYFIERVQVLEQDKENYRKAMENYKEVCVELERRNNILRSDLTANRNLYKKVAKENEYHRETLVNIQDKSSCVLAVSYARKTLKNGGIENE